MLPYLIIGVLLLAVLGVVMIVLVIATWRLQLPEVEEIELADFPAAVLNRQKNLGAKMEEAGFVFAGMQRERRGPKFEVWQALFRTANGAVWGVVEAMQNESPRIVLHSFFENGRTVTTADGEFADYNVTEDWRLTENRFESLKAQATHHQQRSLGVGGKPLPLTTAQEFREKMAETARREFAHLQESGFLTRDSGDEEEYKVAAWKSPAIALRMLLHSKRYKWAEQGRRLDQAYQAELDAEQEERHKYGDLGEYRYLQYYKRDKQKGTVLSLLGWTVRGAILFVSIMALLLIYLANGKLDLATVGIILGVLVAHECGHAAMMQLFGYRDFSVFFLPLVGRLAGNRKARVPAWQETVALLMGPLPGLLVGWGLLIVAYFNPGLPEFWQKVGFWAALINNLNFLAVLPYDGGRLINLLIFERIPALRVIYLLLSGLSVVALVLLSSVVMGPLAIAALWPFLIIGASAFIALPNNLRLARMAPWAKHNLSPEMDETDALMKAFLIVEQTDSVRGLEKRGWTDFVDAVVKHGCSKKLGVLGTGAALALCGFCLTMPVWAFFGVAMGERVRVETEHGELQARIDHLSPRVSWSGAVVTRKTREQLGSLRETYEASLGALYSDDLRFAQDMFEYDARGIFDPSEALAAVRSLRWDEVSTWIAEKDTESRQETARILVKALIGDAKEQAAAGNTSLAMNNYSKAYWAISTCEPKTSLGAWIDWLYLENALLQEIEKLMGTRGIPHQYHGWFASTVRGRPNFEANKMALLLLYDLQGTSLPFAPPAPGPDGQPLNLDGVLAEAGFALRRSQADRDVRNQEDDERTDRFSLGRLMGMTRILQGLPTREEYTAGIAVAEAWKNGTDFDRDVLEDLTDPGQRKLWRGRIDRIRRLQHYRYLAVAAFEMELAMLPAPAQGAQPVASALPIKTTLVTTPGEKFAVTTKAPDGTSFVWKLSPQYALRRRTQ